MGNHRAHLIVGAWYCWCFDLETAINKLRVAIKSFNESKGIENTETNGYHETITVFWATMICSVVENCGRNRCFEDVALAVVTAFASERDLYRQYYSFDVFRSKEARMTLVKPDLKPLQSG